MLVSERIFPPQRKLSVGILSWGAGLNSSSIYGLGRRSSCTLSSTPSQGGLTPKLSLLLGCHYLFKNVDLVFCIIPVAEII